MAKKKKKFHVGEKVRWNSEAGHVAGTIKSIHKSPFKLYGKDGTAYTRHASKDNPVYEIKSNKSDHLAYHYARALHKAQFGGVQSAYDEGLNFQQGLLNSLLLGSSGVPGTNVGNMDKITVPKEDQLRGRIAGLYHGVVSLNSKPKTDYTEPIQLNPNTVSIPSDNTHVATPIAPELDIKPPAFNYDIYSKKIQNYINKKYPDAPVSGKEFANAAKEVYEKYGVVVPAKLAIAQAAIESRFGTSGGRPTRTKNIYNVGNVDSGKNNPMNTWQDGINTYYDLIARKYLKGNSMEGLLENFVDTSGRRYASDVAYEDKLKKIISGLQFKKGGIALTPKQQYTGLNDPNYSEMLFPLNGENTFRGLDSGQPVQLIDETGQTKILYGPNDTTTMKGNVKEKRLQTGGWLSKYQASPSDNTRVAPTFDVPLNSKAGNWLNKLIVRHIYPYGGIGVSESKFKIDNKKLIELGQLYREGKLPDYKTEVMKNSFDKNGVSQYEYSKTHKRSFGPSQPKDLDASFDALRIQQGLPQEYNSFVTPTYYPSINPGKSHNKTYSLSSNLENDIWDDLTKYKNKDFINSSEKKRAVKNSLVADASLKNFMYYKGEDSKGKYISYYDVNNYGNILDYVPNSSPFDIYGRLYYTEDKYGNIKRVIPTNTELSPMDKFNKFLKSEKNKKSASDNNMNVEEKKQVGGWLSQYKSNQ